MHILQPNSLHCFVCGVENKFGLRLRFYETGEGQVTVETVVPPQYQSYPGITHGGIVASLVDEALGRVHMGSDPARPRFMFTAKLTVQYRKPVPIGQPIRIVGYAGKSRQRSAASTAKIFGPQGDLLAEAEAILVDVPPEMVASADLSALGWKVYPEEGASLGGVV